MHIFCSNASIFVAFGYDSFLWLVNANFFKKIMIYKRRKRQFSDFKHHFIFAEI